MKNDPQNVPRLQFIRDACTHLSEQELIEAEARFWRYIEIVRRISEYSEDTKQ